MTRLEGPELEHLKKFFEMAAQEARQAQCLRAKCGTVIIGDGIVLGTGFNGPPLGLVSNRTCNKTWDQTIKPKYDLTCCIHAEWRAILAATKRHGDALTESRLYFMRVDDAGLFTDAGRPFCTVCSRLTLEAGIAEFALWNDRGVDIYSAAEYDRESYHYYTPKLA